MRRLDLFVRAVLWLGVAAFAVGGVWAFRWPASFYRDVATYPPYNLHLFHDVGAFQLGVAAALLAALLCSDVLLAGLYGASAGTVAHAVSHILDRDLGGLPGEGATAVTESAPWVTSALALVSLAGLAARLWSLRRRGAPETDTLRE